MIIGPFLAPASEVNSSEQANGRFVDTLVLTMINSKFEGGDRFRRGYSESTDAYRGPSAALKSLENTIANSELALAA